MKLLVIDDQFSTKLQVEYAMQEWQILVDWVQYPEILEETLAREVFDLAFIDLHYGRRKATGLTAQHIISDSSPSTRAVVYSNEQEDNRVLLLLASYYFFRPFAMLSKGAPDDEIRAVVDAARRGSREPDFAAGGAYRTAAPLVGQLLKRESDLRIWRSLTQYSERNTVARNSYVSASLVSRFAEEKFPAVEEVRLSFLGFEQDAVRAIVQQGGEDMRTPRLAPLHAFAMLHADFFNDRELDQLIEGRREMEIAGDARRRGRFGRRRER
ncbi:MULTISPECIES: response regulator transcription factor [unclassified Streptomyces]|uniref:response regulator transcription factor n=1 Tax=unclassified Streptomyces TaxID=2593676 RepID=UPI0018D61E18|nr:response regulator transcription factor [Streptomyces sp. HB-N217]MBH5133255.1 response regulator transcription factor [Streptomyces sp. HB-N217]